MLFKIEISAGFVFVTPAHRLRNANLDVLVKETRGQYWGKGGYYSFDATHEQAVRAIVDPLNERAAARAAERQAAGEVTPTPAAPVETAPRTSGNHPLGSHGRRIIGGHVYDDDLTGRGRVRIYDES